MKNKIKALAQHLGCNKSEIVQSIYNENSYEYGSQEYLVLTDDEADEALVENVKESLWAFNPDFLGSWLKCPSKAVKAIQDNDQCESNNKVFLDWLDDVGEDIESLAEQAGREDGRGHFLSSYDGQETEETVERETYYIYRQN